MEVEILRDSLTGLFGRQVSLAEAALVSVKVDIQYIEQSVRSHIHWQIWDHSSPINGVSADVVDRRRNFKDKIVYTISVDDTITVIEAFPDSEYDEKTIKRKANKQVNAMVKEYVLQRIALESAQLLEL